MNEELERARKRAEAASSRFDGSSGSSYAYQSPIGKGFSFEGTGGVGSNPYSRRRNRTARTSSSSSTFDIEYEEAHYYDSSSSDLNHARRLLRHRDFIKERMDERRRNRRPKDSEYVNDQGGCVVM